MSKKKLCFFLFTLLLASNNVLAEWYAGGLYTYTIVEPKVITNDEFTPSVFMIKGGYDVYKYIGLELRAGIGFLDGERKPSGDKQTVSIDSMYGGYLKFQGGGRTANPYIMLGYTKVDLEAKQGGTTVKPKDDESVSFGFGVDAVLSEITYLTFEYMRYYDEDAGKISGIGLGLTARF